MSANFSTTLALTCGMTPREVDWCDVHDSVYHSGAPGCVLWMFIKETHARFDIGEPHPCSVTSKFLFDYPKEADNE